jgi:cytochrome c oxidase subunit II
MKMPLTWSRLFAFLLVMVIGFGPAAFAEDQAEPVIKITAKKFEFSPDVIRLKKGVPVILEFTSLDRLHGFNCPDLKVRTDIVPGKISRVRVVPDKTGTFPFHCDIFCGEGHEDMTGTIIVE